MSDSFKAALENNTYVIPTDIDADKYIAELRGKDYNNKILAEIQDMFRDDKGWTS